MQRKVDKLNGKPGSSPAQKDVHQGETKKTPSANSNGGGRSFIKSLLILAFFVITVTIGYILPDGPEKITILGLTVIAVFHVYVIVVAILEKHIGKTTIFLAKAWFALLVIGWFFPGPIWQTWEDVKNWRSEHKDQPYHLIGGSSPVAGKDDTQPQIKSIAVDVPTDDFVVISAPKGYRLSSMECPAENVVEIQDPNTEAVVNQIDCAGQITLRENDVQNKEFVIFQKPDGEEPSKVVTWWKKV